MVIAILMLAAPCLYAQDDYDYDDDTMTEDFDDFEAYDDEGFIDGEQEDDLLSLDVQ